MKIPNYFSKLRPSTLAASIRSHLRSTRRTLAKFARPNSFSFPQTLASIPHRLKRNLSAFRIHYSVLLWISLLLALAPSHKPTMLFLMAASKIALLYEVLLKAVPSTWRLVRRVLDRRFVLGVFLGVVLVELAITGALNRLGVAMGVGAPVILMHAVFFREEAGGSDPEVKEGDADPIGEKKDDADLEEGVSR